MPLPVATALAIGGQGLKLFGARRAQRKMDERLAKSIEHREGFQQQIDARALGLIGDLERATPEAERAAAMEDFMASLAAARAGLPGGGGTPSLGGARARDAERAVATGLDTLGRSESDIASRIVAPGRQRMNEGFKMARAGTDINLINRLMEGQSFVDQLKINSTRPNAMLGFAGDFLTGIGQGMSMRGGIPALATKGPNVKSGISFPKNTRG